MYTSLLKFADNSQCYLGWCSPNLGHIVKSVLARMFVYINAVRLNSQFSVVQRYLSSEWASSAGWMICSYNVNLRGPTGGIYADSPMLTGRVFTANTRLPAHRRM